MERRSRVLCVTTEASGDALLASLLPQLISSAPSLSWEGIGGPLSVQAGLKSHVDPEVLCAHGLTEAINVLPATWRALRHMSALISSARALVLVDAPELNMRLLKRATRAQVPVVYLAPPQVWAWRSWRAERLRSAQLLGCLFEFEVRWFRDRGIAARHLRHPLMDYVYPSAVLEERGPCTLILAPGSRPSAVKASFSVMLSAASQVITRPGSNYTKRLIVAVSPWVSEWIRVTLKSSHERLAQRGIQVELWDQLKPLHRAQVERYVAICHAGTVSLELGLAGVPYVAIAPLSPFSALIAKRLVRAPYFSLPNLILGALTCPELGPDRCHANAIIEELVQLADPTRYNEIRSLLCELLGHMGPQNNQAIALEILKLLKMDTSV